MSKAIDELRELIQEVEESNREYGLPVPVNCEIEIEASLAYRLISEWPKLKSGRSPRSRLNSFLNSSIAGFIAVRRSAAKAADSASSARRTSTTFKTALTEPSGLSLSLLVSGWGSALTKAPEPWRVSIRPKVFKREKASRTTVRLMPCFSTKAFSVGNFSPVFSLPSRMLFSKAWASFSESEAPS